MLSSCMGTTRSSDRRSLSLWNKNMFFLVNFQKYIYFLLLIIFFLAKLKVTILINKTLLCCCISQQLVDWRINTGLDTSFYFMRYRRRWILKRLSFSHFYSLPRVPEEADMNGDKEADGSGAMNPDQRQLKFTGPLLEGGIDWRCVLSEASTLRR